MTGGAAVADDGTGAGGVRRASLLGLLPLVLAAGLTLLAARTDGTSFQNVRLIPPEPVSPLRFALGIGVLLSTYFGVFFAPGLLVMRSLAIRLPNAVANAVTAFVLSLLAVSLGWIVAQAATHGLAGRTCLYLTV
ncbi:MAG TPA: hypothetical protein VKU85_18250, partial [bacterium]|nr:hypothetical protein [bacterium]